MICLDEMGPEAAKNHPGHEAIRPDPTGERRVRAIQEVDYGRRGSGYVFGAFEPATGAALTAPYPGRTIANWVAFLDRVDDWLEPGVVRFYAILDNLSTHQALDVLLWAPAHPRWEFVFQPTYAACFNLIERWWKVLRSLPLKGRRFETWERSPPRWPPRPGTGTPAASPSSGEGAIGAAQPAAPASPTPR